jgi:ubiquinone/menaquinone biosynthesis C-methylase UbiE
MGNIDERVVRIFDDMEKNYDEITDLWYSWLFSRLHYFIAKGLCKNWPTPPAKVLDVGCGTGFQSFIYASLGSNVHGIDISPALIHKAEEKARKEWPINSLELFEPSFPFVSKYSEKTRTILLEKYKITPYVKPQFSVASAEKLPFDANTFDHVNCCGSVLSLCQSYELAISEIHRVLKPGGTFVLEVEAKYTIDDLWVIIDLLTKGMLHFESTLSEALAPFKTPIKEHITIDYPFGEDSNPVYMPLRLFSKSGLHRDLETAGLKPEKWTTIHSVTNIIPSTKLDTSKPSKLLSACFSALSSIEETLPVTMPGCSLVVWGKRNE